MTEKPFIYNSVKENKDRNLNIYFLMRKPKKYFFLFYRVLGLIKIVHFLTVIEREIEDKR